MKQRILIVDDDSRHATLVAYYLQKQGYETLVAINAAEMHTQRERFACHLIILDINMPGEDGLSICQKLRLAGDNTPIIFLTARNELIDKVIGLELGADDYLVKPFESRELLARIRALLRRTSDDVFEPNEAEHIELQFGPFFLDGQARKLFCNDQPVSLSSEEFALLIILASTSGKIFSRSQLASRLLSSNFDIKPGQRNIDMMISRLRKRLDDDPLHTNYIHTLRGKGYVFTSHLAKSATSSVKGQY